MEVPKEKVSARLPLEPIPRSLPLPCIPGREGGGVLGRSEEAIEVAGVWLREWVLEIESEVLTLR